MTDRRLRATALAAALAALAASSWAQTKEPWESELPKDDYGPSTAALAAPQYQPVGKVLEQVPDLPPGTPNPGDLSRFGGRVGSSYHSVQLPGTFEARLKEWSSRKAQVDAAQQKLLAERYDFTGKTAAGVTMSGGKPVPEGPVARLPKGVGTWEELGALTPDQLRSRGLFPYKPLPHPLTSTGGIVFPKHSKRAFQRFDVSFDLPEAYLPEYPPPLFLTTRPDLGDVTKGKLISAVNLTEILDGILTPEQLEGARLAAKPNSTEWLNDQQHRATRTNTDPACLDCHPNGHSAGAFDLDGSVMPQMLRARMKTPSLRGAQEQRLFGLRRSIRSPADHAQTEYYFSQDPGLSGALLTVNLDRTAANRLEAFVNVIGFPPAPKLDVTGRLDPAKASAAEKRGEALFFGKARCEACHTPPAYTDNTMHDLQVERFYKGRAEGWAKTYPLRGIRDSPPYFHDGRLPTLEDTVEFFDLVLSTRLSADEKKDLVAFLRVL